jgi:protein-S-isoprenylcysteine O-methyltransferase Ste14
LVPDSRRLAPLQTARKAGLLALIIVILGVFAVTRSTNAAVHQILDWTGLLLIVVCILGRCWCSLYIGGRKISELVRLGPYSLCRNPLYTFSILGAAGSMAQSGSLVLTAIGTVLCWAVFRMVVPTEEELLLSVHGAAYADYLAGTPRFVPDFRLWRDAEIVEVRPRRLALTLADGLVFLLIIPVSKLLDHLQTIGVIPVLLNLP